MPIKTLSIATDDGTCPARLFTPDGAARAAIIFYMDAFGLRPGLDEMCQRLAGLGYAVLAPDTLYRFGDYGPLDPKTAFSDPKVELRKMLTATTQAMTWRDTAHFIAALDAEGHSGPLGTVGYCMGGARALNAAAHYPGRVAAAASIHGGNLAGDFPESPHNHAAKMRAAVYVAVAGVDKSFPPEQSAKLAEALRHAELDHMIENYVGAAHGWAVPDHSVYDEPAAERHWKRLTMFFEENLNRR